MSKGDKSRVKDKKKYNDNYGKIDFSNRPKVNEGIMVLSEIDRKVLSVAAELLSMHGSEVGDRCCQDWSGSDKLNPELIFTTEEKQKLHYQYEQENSDLEDYLNFINLPIVIYLAYQQG